MKLTKSKLKQIIKEEFERDLKESSYHTVNAQLDQLEDIVATGVEKQQDLEAIAAALQGEGFRDASVVDGALTFTGDDGELYGVALPGRVDLAGDVTAREIGPYVLGVIGGDEEDAEDPRGNLGGMVDVDYHDPIVGRRGNLEERNKGDPCPPGSKAGETPQFNPNTQRWDCDYDWDEDGEEVDARIAATHQKDDTLPKLNQDPMGRGSKTSDLRKVSMRKEHLRQIIREEYQDLMSEVTAGAEKFEDFEALVQAFREDKTDRQAAQEIVYYVEDIVTPEMENLGLVDTATDSAKRNGLFDWSAPRDDPYKNASIDLDLYDDGYEVEVYPSTDEDERQETKAETLMDAINFIRGVLSPQGAVAPEPGEDPAQMEFPLEE